jgi:hypothetical protein
VVEASCFLVEKFKAGTIIFYYLGMKFVGLVAGSGVKNKQMRLAFRS